MCATPLLSLDIFAHIIQQQTRQRGDAELWWAYTIKKPQGQINLHFSESGMGKSLQNATQKSNLTLRSIAWIFFLPRGLLRFILCLGNPGLLIGPETSLTFCLDDY